MCTVTRWSQTSCCADQVQAAPTLAGMDARPESEAWPRRRKSYGEWLGKPGAFVLIAEREESPVGYALVSIGDGYQGWNSPERIADLHDIAVLPNQRGQGIGTALMDSVELELRAAGLLVYRLRVIARNTDALGFYERRGMTVVSHILLGQVAPPTDPVIIELADHSYLIFRSAGMSAEARDELNEWARVPEQHDAVLRGEPSVWQHAFEAGPLLYAVFQGAIGNAAWAIFPAAARHLESLKKRRATPNDAPSAARLARAEIANLVGCADEEVKITKVSPDTSGGWRVSFLLQDGTSGDAGVSPNGILRYFDLPPCTSVS